MSFESPTKEKDPMLGEERETDVSGLIDTIEKKDPSIRGGNSPRTVEETAPQTALTDRMIEMITHRMEQEGVTSDDAIRELQKEGAFDSEPEMSLEEMVRQLNKELGEENGNENDKDGVAA